MSKPSRVRYLSIVVLLLGSLWYLEGFSLARAADSEPPQEGESEKELPEPYDAWHRPVQKESQDDFSLAIASSNDQFGYQLDASAAFNWVDARSGTKVAFPDEDDSFSEPVDIGFDFKFYENTYRQLLVSTNGFISFEEAGETFANLSIPLDTPPNNLIAAFWDDLSVKNGQVYYKARSKDGQKSLVLEWNQVHRYGSNKPLTFEIILYENGDILFQYLDLSGVLDNATVGIEDVEGVDGLLYLYNAPGLSSGKAVAFLRPDPAPRVKILPLYQSDFAYGRLASFQAEVRNTNEEGSDTFDLQADASAPGWKVTFYKADGRTPLPDSDGDGIVDTGSIGHGTSTTIVLKAQAPASVEIGDFNEIELRAISSDDPGVSARADIQAAIPASFAQAYSDSQTGIHLNLTWNRNLFESQVSGFFTGNTLSLAGLQLGGFIYTWEENGSRTSGNGTAYFSDIKVLALDRFGRPTHPLIILTDNGSLAKPELLVNARYPAVAAAPNGRVGLLWAQYQLDLTNSKTNSNIFFAILDSGGNVLFGPVNVTNNTAWRGQSDLDVPTFNNPRIIATEDNRFFLAWIDGRQQPEGETSSIFYAVYNEQGSTVKNPTRFAESVAGSTLFIDPAVTHMTGARVLIAYSVFDDEAQTYTPVYAVLTSGGKKLKEPASIPGSSGWRADATWMPCGNVLLAWMDPKTDQITYAMIDPEGEGVISGPTALLRVGNRKPDYVSVTTDPSGYAVLTWMDAEWKDYLYYALADESGATVTPAMIFLTGQASNPLVQTSFSGQGNAPYDGSWRAFLPGINR